MEETEKRAVITGFTPRKKELIKKKQTSSTEDIRIYNVGDSNYAQHKIQPWDIWREYNLNPWDADIIKRVLREKKSNSRKLDYQKIIHICKEQIRYIEEQEKNANDRNLCG